VSWRQSIMDRYGDEFDRKMRWDLDNGFTRSWEGVDVDEERRAFVETRFAEHERGWTEMVPPRMLQATPDHLDDAASEAFAEWVASSGKRNVMLLGPVGTGKSFAGFAFMRHVHACGVWRGAWTSTVRLMDRLRPSADDPVTVDRLARCDVLLLDDLGGEKPSEWVEERLFALFDERWQWERPTIVTSNLTPEKLRQVVGDRTYSRLQDDAIAVTLTGRDRRRAA
jgi:DNA replication protein DnaC